MTYCTMTFWMIFLWHSTHFSDTLYYVVRGWQHTNYSCGSADTSLWQMKGVMLTCKCTLDDITEYFMHLLWNYSELFLHFQVKLGVTTASNEHNTQKKFQTWHGNKSTAHEHDPPSLTYSTCHRAKYDFISTLQPPHWQSHSQI